MFMKAYFRSLPDSLIESARIDGAGPWRIFQRIAVPLAWPALATVFILNLYIQWSELLLALVMLPSPGKQTLTVAIATLSSQYQTGGPTLAAAATLASLPIIAVFVASRRLFKTGIVLGSFR
jgi:raffinose/stachyose/melibiose transport system permease protein